MNFFWTDKSIQFMEDALIHSSYFQKLCVLLNPYLPKEGNICDAGCGLGFLALELSKSGFNAIAIDQSKEAIDYIKKKNSNVIALNENLFSYTPKEKFSSMIFHYFGSIDEILSIGRRMCIGPLIVIKKSYLKHRFSLTDRKIEGYTSFSAENRLQELGIKYEKLPFDCENGQPFKSIDDALDFFKIYSPLEDSNLLKKDNIEKLLEKTNDKAFPYYLRKKKNSTIFIIRKY